MRGLFGRIADGLEQKATDVSALTWSKLFGEDYAVKSGVSVNIDTALKTATVLSCARVLAEGVAQLPLKLYRIGQDESRELATDHPVYRLIYRRPNDWMTSFELRETMMLHAVLCKGAYAYINRNGRKEPKELIPLVPGRCKPSQSRDYTLTYDLYDADGKLIGRVPRSDILHIRGPSWNGYEALDIVQTAREAIGLAIATEETHARLHSNGARPGGIISFDQPLGETAKQSLREAWDRAQAGTRNAFKTAVLDAGAKWQSMAMTGVDSQHIETRKFQIEEICRAFRVFPQMIGHTDKTATFASAEAFFLAHVVHSLGPWIERWEQSIARDLLEDDLRLQAKFSVQGLLRGDAASRAEFYANGIVNGYFTRNEVRRWEELNPLDGLDEPLVPLNLGTAEDAAALQDEVTNALLPLFERAGSGAVQDGEIRAAVLAAFARFIRTRRN